MRVYCKKSVKDKELRTDKVSDKVITLCENLVDKYAYKNKYRHFFVALFVKFANTFTMKNIILFKKGEYYETGELLPDDIEDGINYRLWTDDNATLGFIEFKNDKNFCSEKELRRMKLNKIK